MAITGSLGDWERRCSQAIAIYERTWHGGQVDTAALQDLLQVIERAGAPADPRAGEGAGPDGGGPGPLLDEVPAPHLTDDLWCLVFAHLPAESLARCAAVSRQWARLLLRERPHTWGAAFTAAWGLRGVHGAPSSNAFWRGGLAAFGISHRLTRLDTVAGLALRYHVQPVDILRLNNMLSESGVHVRERLLIPVASARTLVARDCYIEMDRSAQREVAVVYLQAAADGSVADGPSEEELAARDRVRARAQERLRQKLLSTLKRSLRVDDGTVSYYLAQAGGDIRAAVQQCMDDSVWEREQEQQPQQQPPPHHQSGRCRPGTSPRGLRGDPHGPRSVSGSSAGEGGCGLLGFMSGRRRTSEADP